MTIKEQYILEAAKDVFAALISDPEFQRVNDYEVAAQSAKTAAKALADAMSEYLVDDFNEDPDGDTDSDNPIKEEFLTAMRVAGCSESAIDLIIFLTGDFSNESWEKYRFFKPSKLLRTLITDYSIWSDFWAEQWHFLQLMEQN